MSGDKMEVEMAEQKLKTMDHSEQHYFKRYVFFFFYYDLGSGKRYPKFFLGEFAASESALLTYNCV
jgi:protein arginine N-methyltransferase 1